MAARPSRPDRVNEYEQKRLDRIAANQAKLGECQNQTPTADQRALSQYNSAALLMLAAASLYVSFVEFNVHCRVYWRSAAKVSLRGIFLVCPASCNT